MWEERMPWVGECCPDHTAEFLFHSIWSAFQSIKAGSDNVNWYVQKVTVTTGYITSGIVTIFWSLFH